MSVALTATAPRNPPRSTTRHGDPAHGLRLDHRSAPAGGPAGPLRRTDREDRDEGLRPAQRMTRNGAPAAAVIRQGRWATGRMVARYTRGETAGKALRYL